jgi:hypothetical protein
MLLARSKSRFTPGASVMDATLSNAYWLLDGSALAPSELDGLTQARRVHWLYDHVADDQARVVGPVLVERGTSSDELAERLQADEARAWAIASLHTQADFDALVRHLAALRYLHTRDGQRYYLRYADSRCLTALWPTLMASQQRALLGPIHRWHYSDRQLHGQSIEFDQEASADVAGRSCLPMRLSDQQLGSLLQRCWPDQLLYSAIEQQPDAGRDLTHAQRHDCAQRVCDWLTAAQEERYPVQVEMLKRSLLSMDSVSWDKSTWEKSLRLNHEHIINHVVHDSSS